MEEDMAKRRAVQWNTGRVREKVNLAKKIGWPLNRPRENDSKCVQKLGNRH